GWKIFYANEEGTFIIAADYVRSDNPILAEALAKANIGTREGYPYSAYWPNASYLTKKDAEGNAIIDSNASNFMYNWTYGGLKMNNKIAVAALLDTNAWSGFVTDGATMAIGGPTIEMFRASWNEKTYESGTHTKLQIAPKDVGSGYYVALNDDDNFKPKITYAGVKSDAGYGDLLYMPHPDWRGYGKCDGYWFASPAPDQLDYPWGVNLMTLNVDWLGR
ncbi:MAG: hypothetical protein IJV31_07145, partial [Clostridia bacterium]|nr:hypothetical protein [Clostridia bacterium]